MATSESARILENYRKPVVNNVWSCSEDRYLQQSIKQNNKKYRGQGLLEKRANASDNMETSIIYVSIVGRRRKYLVGGIIELKYRKVVENVYILLKINI